jgi:hypothetical protein
LRDDSGGVMAANVEESAELAIVAANDDQWLFVDINGEELARFADLIETSDHLPICGENAAAFQSLDAAIEIPRRRDGVSAFERIGRIVEIQDVADRGLMHAKDSGKNG